MKAGRGRV